MSNTDSRILELFYDQFKPPLKPSDVQELLDTLVEEATDDLQKDLEDKREAIQNVTKQLGKLRRDVETLYRANTDLSIQNNALWGWIHSLENSRNLFVRFLSKRLILRYSTLPIYQNEQFRAIAEIHAEMVRQDAKWGANRQQPNGTGPNTHPLDGLYFDVGEEMKASDIRSDLTHFTDKNFASGKGTWANILSEEWAEAMAESNPRHLKNELTQVGAVAANWKAAMMLQARKGILRKV